MKLMDWFSTPVMMAHLPNGDAINRQLAKDILASENEDRRCDDRRETQSQEVFESQFDFFEWDLPSLQPVKQFVQHSVGRLIVELNGYNREQANQLRLRFHSWYHITRKGGFQTLHNHPMASWSGIYCVQQAKSHDEPDYSGAVRFHDPRSNSNYYSDLANQNLQGRFAGGSRQLRHKEGQLIIFPSYLQHEVLPYCGDSERIIIAFNSWVR